MSLPLPALHHQVLSLTLTQTLGRTSGAGEGEPPLEAGGEKAMQHERSGGAGATCVGQEVQGKGECKSWKKQSDPQGGAWSTGTEGCSLSDDACLGGGLLAEGLVLALAAPASSEIPAAGSCTASGARVEGQPEGEGPVSWEVALQEVALAQVLDVERGALGEGAGGLESREQQCSVRRALAVRRLGPWLQALFCGRVGRGEKVGRGVAVGREWQWLQCGLPAAVSAAARGARGRAGEWGESDFKDQCRNSV